MSDVPLLARCRDSGVGATLWGVFVPASFLVGLICSQRIGSLATAVDLSGGIDWVFPFDPVEACRACQSPLMKRVCDMWLALSSFFHPCTLEVRSERPMASSLPPRLQTCLYPPLLGLTSPLQTTCLIHAFKP